MGTRYHHRSASSCAGGVSERDLAHIRHAMRVAEHSEHKFRHGAVVVSAGRVLSFSPNVDKGSPNHPPTVFSTHAEVRAAAMSPIVVGATIYVARLAKDGIAAIAMPCKWCHMSLAEMGFARVVFTVDELTVGSYKIRR